MARGRRIRVGLSGWTYDSWRGPFYPRGLPRGRPFEHASRELDTLEINGSFYSLQRPEGISAGARRRPAGSCSRSREAASSRTTRNWATCRFRSPTSSLRVCWRWREKLGPIVWQLAANLRFDAERVNGFLALLPRNTEDASRLARRHDHRLAGQSWLRAGRRRRIRHAIEIRNESFLVPEMARIARHHGVALVVSDAGHWRMAEEITAGFVYLRLHGSPRTYASLYGRKRLAWWCDRIERWHRGSEPPDAARVTERLPPRRTARDVYVYFDNDQHAHAPRDAAMLKKMIEGRAAYQALRGRAKASPWSGETRAG